MQFLQSYQNLCGVKPRLRFRECSAKWFSALQESFLAREIQNVVEFRPCLKREPQINQEWRETRRGLLHIRANRRFRAAISRWNFHGVKHTGFLVPDMVKLRQFILLKKLQIFLNRTQKRYYEVLKANIQKRNNLSEPRISNNSRLGQNPSAG